MFYIGIIIYVHDNAMNRLKFDIIDIVDIIVKCQFQALAYKS